MKKVYILTFLLLIGLVLSQVIPFFPFNYSLFSYIINMGTIVCLAFIMIYVGYEFEIRKEKIKEYGNDYLIAFSAATLPWVFVTLYFVYILTPASDRSMQAWIESLLAARFAAPTSAGVLFSMLAAAGLASTWMFKKTRILAIFDDLDTVILMIPLQMLIIGFRIELLFVLVIMFAQIWLLWRYLNTIKLSMRWNYVLIYSVLIASVSEGIYLLSKTMYETVGVHIEVLLPAFVLGTMISKKHNRVRINGKSEETDIIELESEKQVSFIVSAIFMLLVGLSLPVLDGGALNSPQIDDELVDVYVNGNDILDAGIQTAQTIDWGLILFHVLMVTLLSNIGKMVPAFMYRKEANWRERLAVAIAMFPRGEVGAGILIISMSYGIKGMIVTVSMLSLALNLLLTGFFIAIVISLLKKVPETRSRNIESNS